MALTAGSHLGPYGILAPLGAGGMGEVYRARDPRLDREVVIKVLRDEITTDPNRLQRFQNEAKAAGVQPPELPGEPSRAWRKTCRSIAS